MFDLAKNRSRLTQDHHLNRFGIIPVPNATHQISRQSVHCFQKRGVLKVFNMNGHGGHVGYVTWTVCKNSSSISPRKLYMKSQWLLRRCLKLPSMRVRSQRSNNDIVLKNLQVLIKTTLTCNYRIGPYYAGRAYM